jgi:hypothetical protein
VTRNNSMQRTALRAAADAERWAAHRNRGRSRASKGRRVLRMGRFP